MNRLSRRQLLTAVTMVTLMAESVLAEWHYPLCVNGGGWWRQRIKVVVRNDRSRAVDGEPVVVKVGSGPGEADLAGQSARAVRVCNERGQEMLYAIVTPHGDRVADGPIPRGSDLLIPAECPAGKSAAYYVYFDNPAAWEVPDFLAAQPSVVNGDMERGKGDTPTGWDHDRADAHHRATWSTEEPQSGKRCLKTTVDDGAEPTWISTRQGGISIQGGAKYRLRVWVRAENVRGTTGWYIHVGNLQNPMLISPILNGGEGTYGWKEVTAEFTAPAEADRADLGTVLRGTGTAWFDHVILECLEAGGVTATAEQMERLELQEIGTKAAWPEEVSRTALGSRRAAVEVINLSPREQPQALVCAAVGALRTRLAGRDGTLAVFTQGKEVPSRLLGDLYLFQTSLSGRSRHTCYVYAAGHHPQDGRGDRRFALPPGWPIFSGTRNLVKNPGFEQGDKLPAHWTHDAASPETGVTFSIDRPEKPDLDRQCVKMHVPATASHTWRGWHQTVPVLAGRTYLVAASVKCKDVQGGEVRVHFHLYGPDGKLSKHEPMQSIGPGISGTTDWTLMTGLLTVPEDAVEVQLHLTMQGAGTVWHDDLVLAEVTLGTIGRLEGRPLGPSEVRVWPVPAVIKVFEDDPAPRSSQQTGALRQPTARITAARRDREPLQVALRSGRAIPGVRVDVAPPIGPGGARLEDFETCTVGYVPIDHPTNYYQSKTPAWHRKVPTQPGACDGWPGRWPDPLLPKDTFDLAANTTQPVWITIGVPKDAAAGDYAGKVRFRAGDRVLAEMPFTVHVWDFALPEESHVGAIYDVRVGDAQRIWGKPGREAHGDLVEFMARRRLCPDRIQPESEIKYASGRVTADFTAFDRAAEHYFNDLKLPFSYTPGSFYLFGWGMPPGAHFGEQPYPGKYPYEGADRGRLRPEFKRAYQACLKAFWDHVKEKGWEKKFVLYISDEPFDAQPAIRQQMKALSAMIHEVDPAIPIYSSTWKHVPEWDGTIGIWGFGHYGVVSPEQMARTRHRGDRIWYTTDGHMCIDTPYCAIERLLPHYCFKYGVQAYEFWGISWYTYDPFRFGWHRYIHQSDQPGTSYWVRYPNGDGYLVYPGHLIGVDGPISSIRCEQAREGVEDYEYLYLLRESIARARAAGRDTAKAEQALAAAGRLVSIPNAGGRYSSKFLPDPDAVYRVKETVAEAIERLKLTGREQ